jgi:hypothetical protein
MLRFPKTYGKTKRIANEMAVRAIPKIRLQKSAPTSACCPPFHLWKLAVANRMIENYEPDSDFIAGLR